jgi:hypothetical protein
MTSIPLPLLEPGRPCAVRTSPEPQADPPLTVPAGTTAEAGLPLILRPAAEGPADFSEVLQWYRESRALLEQWAQYAGAVLLRGFAIPDATSFGRLAHCHPEHRLQYVGGATPRARIEGNVYESTRIDARFRIGLHQEKSYMAEYPRWLAFYCEKPCEEGGETLLCDMLEMTRRLPRELKDTFRQRGVKYIRNFRDRDCAGSDLEHGALEEYHRVWQEALDCQTRSEAEERCTQAGLQYHWLGDGSLTVSNVRPALIEHPRSREAIWFNQATTQHLNARSLGVSYFALRHFYGPRPAFPYEVRYGDDGPMTVQELTPVYDTLQSLELKLPWCRADYLLVDNIRMAHGRSPFRGDRVVRVALMD